MITDTSEGWQVVTHDLCDGGTMDGGMYQKKNKKARATAK